jgi:hypothetical protein
MEQLCWNRQGIYGNFMPSPFLIFTSFDWHHSFHKRASLSLHVKPSENILYAFLDSNFIPSACLSVCLLSVCLSDSFPVSVTRYQENIANLSSVSRHSLTMFALVTNEGLLLLRRVKSVNCRHNQQVSIHVKNLTVINLSSLIVIVVVEVVVEQRCLWWQ